jgi:phage tail protein X
MTARYRTVDGDVLDAICRAHYGTEAQIGPVLDANPGLAAVAPIYPAGVEIDLPDLPEPATGGTLRLWGTAP